MYIPKVKSIFSSKLLTNAASFEMIRINFHDVFAALHEFVLITWWHFSKFTLTSQFHLSTHFNMLSLIHDYHMSHC